MNPILTMDPENTGTGGGYYARVDSIEALDPQSHEQIVQLDGVEMSAFRRAYKGDSLLPAIDYLPLAIMEFWSLDVPPHFRWLVSKDVLVPGRWLEVMPAETPDAVPVDYYLGLFALARTLKSYIKPVEDRELIADLNRAFSLDQVPDSTVDVLYRTVLRGAPVDFVSVLDVGQGNANALWRTGGPALLYFDFGGGVTANARTFPKQPLHPCFSFAPPIVLSHWDWDHWSSAARYPTAFDSRWIAPRPFDLGPTHLAFASELLRRGNLSIWPHDLTDLDCGDFRVQQCTGTDRNNAGLAILICGRHTSGAIRFVLLTGDASYDHIPAACSIKRFDALVASHHGGIVESMTEIGPTGSDATLVYSVGHANYYGHPRLHAALAYLQGGWNPDRTFSTAQHIRNRPNTIGVSITGNPVKTGCPQCMPAVVC